MGSAAFLKAKAATLYKDMKPKKLTRVERNIAAVMKVTSDKYDKFSDRECITLWEKAYERKSPAAKLIYEFAISSDKVKL